MEEEDGLKSRILSVYNSLSTENLPFSYGVVNCDYGQQLASFEHHFINYTDFLMGYSERDSIYHNNRNDKIFLRDNPSYVLPKSIFVFIAKTDDFQRDTHLATPNDISKEVKRALMKLRKKGRKIEAFYSDDYLTVYKVINEERLSNLNDLIFNL